jgi:hypothetical protein
LAESSDQAAAANIVLATRLKLLVVLGYAPEMTRCASCGAEGPFCGFSPGLGGVLCAACWAGDGGVAGGEHAAGGTETEAGEWPERDGAGSDGRASGPCFALSAGAVATLQVLVDRPLAELEGFDIDSRAVAEVEHVLARTLGYHGH